MNVLTESLPRYLRSTPNMTANFDCLLLGHSNFPITFSEIKQCVALLSIMKTIFWPQTSPTSFSVRGPLNPKKISIESYSGGLSSAGSSVSILPDWSSGSRRWSVTSLAVSPISTFNFHGGTDMWVCTVDHTKNTFLLYDASDTRS